MRLRLAFTAAAAALLFPAALAAQTASYTFFGTPSQSCPLGVQGTPKLGTTYHLIVRPGWTFGNVIATTFLYTGVSNTKFAGYTLPLPLESLSHCRRWDRNVCVDTVTFYGSLLTSSDWLGVVPFSPQKEILVPCTVPNDAALLGVSYYQQAFTYDSGVNGFFFVRSFHFSRGGHGVIGT